MKASFGISCTNECASCAVSTTSPGVVDRFSVRQPAFGLQKHLPGPVGQLLVSSFALFVVTFRRSQHRQEGQRPGLLRPWNSCQQHQTQPAQATGFDEVAVARTDRISVNPFRFDLLSPATLEGIIQTHHHWSTNGKCSHQQSQQQTAGFPARPDGSVEHSMKILKVLFAPQSHNPQNGSHRPLSRRQDGPQQQDLNMLPYSLGKKSGKGRQDRGLFAGQGRHGSSSWQRKYIAYLAFC
jgi:hypothetical protein